jgi:hypothetical protein
LKEVICGFHNFSTVGYKWYGATNNIMTLGGTGNLRCSGSVSSASSSTTGNATVGGTLTVADLSTTYIQSQGVYGVQILKSDGGIAAKFSNEGNAILYGDVTASNVTVGGNLFLTGYLSAKPFVSLRVATQNGSPSFINAFNGLTIGTPGGTMLTNRGYNTTVSLSRGTPTATNAFLYTFTWTGAHPLGTDYNVFAQFQTGSTDSDLPLGVITTNVTSSTSFTVWVRTSLNANFNNVLVDGTFYVYTVP